MSKHNWVTIKNKHNGFLRAIAESEFNGMIDKADYDIVSTEKTISANPDKSWTVDNIKKWLDDNGVVYTGTHNTKPKLLALVNA